MIKYDERCLGVIKLLRINKNAKHTAHIKQQIVNV